MEIITEGPARNFFVFNAGMQPFWRESQLSEAEFILFAKVLRAHQESAQRPNVSSQVLQMTVQGSSRYLNGLAAALLSLGGPHAPIPQTMQLLAIESVHLDKIVIDALHNKQRVPGWGNAFEKLHPDPLWKEVDACLMHHFPEWHEKIQKVTNIMHAYSKDIYPNASAYTAVACLILGIPEPVSFYLVVAGRLDAWSNLLLP